MRSSTAAGGGGMQTAVPGRLPPIQFIETCESNDLVRYARADGDGGGNEGGGYGGRETNNLCICGSPAIRICSMRDEALGMLLLDSDLPSTGGTWIECQLPKGRSGHVKQMPAPRVSGCSFQG